jgi:hypothetical protein
VRDEAPNHIKELLRYLLCAIPFIETAVLSSPVKLDLPRVKLAEDLSETHNSRFKSKYPKFLSFNE